MNLSANEFSGRHRVVFLSYSHADNSHARQLFQNLLEVWLESKEEDTKNYRSRYLAYSKRQQAAGQPRERRNQIRLKWILRAFRALAWNAYCLQLLLDPEFNLGFHPNRDVFILVRHKINQQLKTVGVPCKGAEGP